MSDMMIFSGNATPKLAEDIARYMGISLSDATIARFSDGEINIEINENVRGQDVFIIQSTCSPANENLMELIIMADALRRASAARITAVVPYFGYARQDRRVRSARVAISAKVVADMMAIVGINRVLTVDLHADQIQGFFDFPVDNVYGTPIMLEDINKSKPDQPVVVSPDVGGVIRARALAKRLQNDTDLAIIDKRRPGPNMTEVMNVIGEVDGKSCLIIDDIVDTAGTLCTAAKALKNEGAKEVKAYCTHPVLSGKALDNLANSELDQLIVTDTIPLTEAAIATGKIRVISLANMLAEAMRRVNTEESLSSMFLD